MSHFHIQQTVWFESEIRPLRGPIFSIAYNAASDLFGIKTNFLQIFVTEIDEIRVLDKTQVLGDSLNRLDKWALLDDAHPAVT